MKQDGATRGDSADRIGPALDLLCRFNEIAGSCGDHVAVIEASTEPGRTDESYSYQALDKRRKEIAGALVNEYRLGAGDRIGLVQSRQFETIAAMLAIATIGATYVPLDGELPPDRLRYLLEDARIRVMLSASDEPLPGAVAISRLTGESNNPAAPDAGRPLYLMYTSGSTGQPKGVLIPHRAVHRLVVAPDFMELDEQTRFLQLAPQSFDAATLEIWGPLLNGGTCVLYPDEVFDPGKLDAIVRKHAVNALWLTVALFNQVVIRQPAALGKLNFLLFGGERASASHVRKARRLWPAITLINGYGPTENTTFTCCHQVRDADLTDPSGQIPIGKAIRGTLIRVVNEDLEDVATGSVGELLAGGEGLAIEYLNQQQLTRERFVFDGTGERWYRTGDLVDQDKEGVIHFHGRADRQLKLHGHRIEPGEVETAILADETIRNAYVMALKSADGEQKLAAYLVGSFDRSGLQKRLGSILPRYLVPSLFIAVDTLPVTANGKVDVAALPNPLLERKAPDSSTSGSDMKGLLVATWQAVVPGLALSSTDDNFFDVGGTSMDLLQVREALENQLGINISLVTLYRYPTVSKLASYLQRHSATDRPEGSARDRAAQRRRQLARRRAERAGREH